MNTLNIAKSALLFFISLLSLASIHTVTAAQKPDTQFAQLMAEINQTLAINQHNFLEDKHVFATFVDKLLISNWATDQTVKLLAGKQLWQRLTNNEKLEMVAEFNNTLQRYAQEGFDYYEDQRIEFIGVKVNTKHTRGRLKVRVHPKILPSFDIDFKVLNKTGGWKLYDVMVQGVSYIRLKRDEVREAISNQGVSAILAKWKEKNHGYLPSIPQHSTEHTKSLASSTSP